MKILINISVGEFLDKISILKIKVKKINDKRKMLEVKKELSILNRTCKNELENFPLWIKKLQIVNEKLWEIEDNIRQKEKQKCFDKEFIELARQVYQINDLRFKIKNKINSLYKSEIKEQKYFKNLK